MSQVKEIATCRGCGKQLIGEPYYTGKGAIIPETKERASSNFYGGYVCSYECDYRASIEQESSFGAGVAKQLSSGSLAQLKKNWPNY